MSGVTTRPSFWVAVVVLSVLSAVFAWRYFPEALPRWAPGYNGQLTALTRSSTTFFASPKTIIVLSM